MDLYRDEYTENYGSVKVVVTITPTERLNVYRYLKTKEYTLKFGTPQLITTSDFIFTSTGTSLDELATGIEQRKLSEREHTDRLRVRINAY